MREARYITREHAQQAAKYIRGPQVSRTTVIKHGDNDYGILAVFAAQMSFTELLVNAHWAATPVPEWLMNWFVNNSLEAQQ